MWQHRTTDNVDQWPVKELQSGQRVRGRMYGHGHSIIVTVWWPGSYKLRGGSGERIREGWWHYLRHPSSSSWLSWASVLMKSEVRMMTDVSWSLEDQHWDSWPLRIWRLETSLGNLALKVIVQQLLVATFLLLLNWISEPENFISFTGFLVTTDASYQISSSAWHFFITTRFMARAIPNSFQFP